MHSITCQGNLVTDRSSDWTDEKHSLYLKSMEASFVNELYDNRQKHLNTRNPSGQVPNYLFFFYVNSSILCVCV